MTTLQVLAALLSDVADRIAETDREQTNEDMEAGVIEGKLAAYREMAKSISKSIEQDV